jgi:preprotein translocase subunit SecG
MVTHTPSSWLVITFLASELVVGVATGWDEVLMKSVAWLIGGIFLILIVMKNLLCIR